VETGNFELSLPTSTLTQLEPCAGRGREIYGGSAEVRREESGVLSLRFLSSKAIPTDRTFSMLDVPAGEVIPNTEFFTLDGLETDGRKWIGARMLPEISSGSGGTVISAALDELRVEGVFPRGLAPSVTLYFRSSARVDPLPRMEFGPTAIMYAPNSRPPSFAASDKWELGLAGTKGGFCVELQATSGHTLPAHANEKLLRALELWTGDRLEPVAEVMYDGSKCEVAIKAGRGMAETTSFPVQNQSPTLLGDRKRWLVLLLDRLLVEPSTDWSPFVIHLRSANGAIGQPLDQAALALSVAAEGMVTSHFKDVRRSDHEDHAAAVDQAIELISSSSLPESFRSRARGALSGIKGVRAGDLLKALEEQGQLPVGSGATWSSLRNKAAHAASLSATDAGLLFRQCCQALMLVRRLAFLAAKYEGHYVDYSEMGWANARWPSESHAKAPPGGVAPPNQ